MASSKLFHKAFHSKSSRKIAPIFDPLVPTMTPVKPCGCVKTHCHHGYEDRVNSWCAWCGGKLSLPAIAQ